MSHPAAPIESSIAILNFFKQNHTFDTPGKIVILIQET